MAKSCKEIAESLVACMKKTECVKNGGGIKKCMVTDENCVHLRNGYAACKRQAFDMRNRIRGERLS